MTDAGWKSLAKDAKNPGAEDETAHSSMIHSSLKPAEESKYTDLDSRGQSMDLGLMDFDADAIERSGTISLHGYPDVRPNQLADIEARATVLYKADEAPANLSKKQSKRNKILMDLSE